MRPRSLLVALSLAITACATAGTPAPRYAPSFAAVEIDDQHLRAELVHVGPSRCRLSVHWRGTQEGSQLGIAPSRVEPGASDAWSMTFEVETPPLGRDAVVWLDGELDCDDRTRTVVTGETVAGPEGWRQLCKEHDASARIEPRVDPPAGTTGAALELRAGRVPRLADAESFTDGGVEQTRGRRLVDLCTGDVLLDLSGTPLQVAMLGDAAASETRLSPDERAYLLARRGVGVRYRGLVVDVIPVDPAASWPQLWPTLREPLATNPEITRVLFGHTVESRALERR